MVWYGMVWYGMVWYGMVWYGMVCSGEASSCRFLEPVARSRSWRPELTCQSVAAYRLSQRSSLCMNKTQSSALFGLSVHGMCHCMSSQNLRRFCTTRRFICKICQIYVVGRYAQKGDASARQPGSLLFRCFEWQVCPKADHLLSHLLRRLHCQMART